MIALPGIPRQGNGGAHSLAGWLHYCVLAVIIGIGSYLRLTMLREQSLWFDEADIVVRAQRPWSDILSTFTVQGENGPLYNVMLAAWVRIAGISEVAVRFPSAIAGILALPVIYLLARRLAGAQAGLIAAGLLVVSPYHIWYSQEAKMYSLLTLLALLSTLLLTEALNRENRWIWLSYVVVTTAMFYTHVASVLVFAGQILFVLATYKLWRSQRRTLAIVGAALTLPYLPIAIWAIKVVGGNVPTWHENLSIVEAFRIIGIKFAVFRSTPEIEFRAGWLYFIIAAATAIWLLAKPARRTVGLLLVSVTLAPVVGIWLVSLRNSVFSDRYVIAALPTYLILIAIGIVYLARSRWGLIPAFVLAMLLVAYTWFPVSDVNRSTIAQKEDWRSAYARVAERAEPDDVFLMHPGYVISTLAYYGQRDPRLGGHPVGTIPVFGPDWMTAEVMEEMLREEFGHFRRFWLIESPDRTLLEDPDHELERWLDSNGEILYEDRVNGVRVALYEFPVDW